MAPRASRPFVVSRRAFMAGLLAAPLSARAVDAESTPTVPILVYHRFAPTAVDSMTVRLATFEAHLRVLERLGCQVMPLLDWVAWRRGESTTALPARAVAITADDGHRSQFESMAARLDERRWPYTLFVYPSAISNASYAMTWSDVADLAARPGVSVQSHTFWHPNFIQERRRLSPGAFTKFAADQLRRSRDVIEQRLSRPVSLLAWPFGLSDEGVRRQAADSGYRAGFSLGNRSATLADPIFDLPRHLMVDSVGERQLELLLSRSFAHHD